MRPIADVIPAAIDCVRGLAITWGFDDCLMWLADIYVEALGRDPAEAYRGRYRTAAGACHVLGCGGVPAALEACGVEMDWPEIDPKQASVGDLGMIDTLEGAAGVIFYQGFWVGRVDYGFSVWRTPCVTRAWRVI
jgi:hypothetical protein